jgi:cardiolipin synthase
MKHVPNTLTILRLAIAPMMIIAFLGFGETGRYVAMALFAVAAATDWLDGWIARKLDVTSAFGAMLDPVADKVVVLTAIALLMIDGTVSGFAYAAAGAIMLRELGVSALRARLGAALPALKVTRAAQFKTVAQMIALLLLFAAPLAVTLHVLGLTALWLAAALALITGAAYVRAAWPVLRPSGG